ncbi:hypothetical protein C2E23DRAFT_617651 [Lenzites betulinus]|nr:hypothetical protein C2E23DRAFT_617651 [Lenzites betulinus]
MSFLSRLFRRIRNPRGFVGSDLEGNQFFELPSPHGSDSRTKRVVKYADGRDMWAYVGGKKRLAIQWTSWLTHTRQHAPTLEELHADLARQRRVLFNAALIEARDREEAARIAASQQVLTPGHIQAPLEQVGEAPEDTAASTTASMTATEPQNPPETTHVEPPTDRPQPPAEQWSPWKPPPSDEPHSWQPRASVRRGG